MGKPIVGYRTETRAPYGPLSDAFKGMHFFCHFPCDYMIYLPPPLVVGARNIENIHSELALKIDEGI